MESSQSAHQSHKGDELPPSPSPTVACTATPAHRRRPYALVTGGAGFIGSHVVDRLVSEGYEVTVVDTFVTGQAENLTHHAANPHVHIIHHDVRQSLLAVPLPVCRASPEVTTPTKDASSSASPSHDGMVGEQAVQIDCVFHLACPAAPDHYQADPIFTTMTCVLGTHNALELATQHDCPILIASTSEVYGDPLQHPQKETYHGNVSCTGARACYDEGKRCAESLAFDFHRHRGTRVRVVRIFNTYGPRMAVNDGRVVSNFIVNALRGTPLVIYGDGTQTRSLQYVDDLVEGLVRFVRHPTEVGPINMGSCDERTVLSIAHNVLSVVEAVQGEPSPSLITHGPAVADDPFKRMPDTSKAHSLLGGWEPRVLLVDGLTRTVVDVAERLKTEKKKPRNPK